MTKTGACFLKVKKLRLMVHLGCTAGEREITQPVDVDIFLRFSEMPEGAHSDSLKGTVCYDAISAVMKKTVADGTHFHLLEKLALSLFTSVRKDVDASVGIWIEVTKLHPPVTDLNGGVTFSFGDWVPTSNL